MKLNVDQFIARSKQAFENRDLNRQIFEDCYEYYMPFRNTFNEKGGNTINKGTKQFDSTAMSAAVNFVNTMQQNFTPVFSRWAEIKAGPGVPEKKRTKINKQLAKMMDKVFAYINASNFHTAMAEMFFDWGMGSASLWLHEGDQNQPLNFVATPIAEMGLVEGRFGSVDGRFREYSVKARLLKATWPGQKVKLNDDLEKLAKESPDADVQIVEGCYYDYINMVWIYQVVHTKTKHSLLEIEFSEQICFTPRWHKIPGQAFGVGPFIMALADVKTLNKMKEYMLKNAAFNVFGMYTIASTGGFNPNNVRLEPGSFIPVERNGGPNGATIAPMPRTGDFNVQEFMIQDLQDSIRKTMLDVRLPEQQAQPATAFEIAERIAEFQQDIGTAYGRAMYEFVQPLFQRIIRILARKGIIEVPDGFEIDNFFYEVQIVSPIAQTQAIQDLQKFIQAFQMVSSISPELALMAFEVEKSPQFITEKSGAPAEMLRDIDPKELKEVALAMFQQQQNAAAQEGAAQ